VLISSKLLPVRRRPQSLEVEIPASSINRRSLMAVGIVVPLNLLEDERFPVSLCWLRLSD
jgi:hypothetical protein